MQVQPLNIVFLIGFIAYVVIRGVFERRVGIKKKVVNRMDWRERGLQFIVFIGCLLLPALFLLTSWLMFADYVLPAFAPWCGTVVMGTSLWLFWRSHTDLGQNWSRTLELREGHQLVTHGVYKSIRHPMYTSIWLFGLGQGLLLQNWLAGWSAFVTFAFMYFVRVCREEQMMCEHFGQEYNDYMRQTGRLFPRIRIRSDA